MGIGFSIFLIAVGAILTFALNTTVAGIDLDIVGWILMGAGALGLIIYLSLYASRRNRTSSDPLEPPPPPTY